MKLSACYVIYDDFNFLELSIASIYNSVDKIFILHNEKPWNGTPRPEKYEKCKQLLTNLSASYPKIQVISGTWENEHVQRNFGLKLAKEGNYSHQLIVDGDEVYEPKEMQNFIQNILSQHQEVACFHLNWATYFRLNPLYRIEPRESFQPLFCVNVNQFLFYDKRAGLTADKYGIPTQKYESAQVPPHLLLAHHFSYSLSDEDLQSKLKSTMHSHEILPDWYDNVWKKFDENPDMRHLHPVSPRSYQRAVKVDMSELPLNIQNYFKAKK